MRRATTVLPVLTRDTNVVSSAQAAALAATRAAAIACQPFVGRGDKHAADLAATEAMRSVLAGAPGVGTVVIGEGEKDGAPMLFNGERLGGGRPLPARPVALHGQARGPGRRPGADRHHGRARADGRQGGKGAREAAGR